MSRRIFHSLIAACFLFGVCVLCFCPLRASARMNAHPRTSAGEKSRGHAAKFQEQSAGKISGGSKFEDLQASNGHVAWVEQKAGLLLSGIQSRRRSLFRLWHHKQG